MAFEKEVFIDYPDPGYTKIRARHLNKLQDAIAALDGALDAKEVEVEKVIKSTNRFDKNTIEFIKPFYIPNRIPTDYKFSYNSSTAGDMATGYGWVNIPVESGKTYTMKIDTVTMEDFYNYKYGYFMNVFWLDGSGTVVTNVSYGGDTYYYAIASGSAGDPKLADTAYNANKVRCYAYGGGSNTRRGMGTNAITFEVKDSSICYMNVQLGFLECKSPIYQLDTTLEFWQTKKGLTDAQCNALINSFQINEGTKLLDYEEGGDYTYTETEVQSNLTKLQSAFQIKQIPSTNLLDPAYARNHYYIYNGGLNSDGSPRLVPQGNSYPCCMLVIPVQKGQYILDSTATKIGNGEFGYFGKCVFVDASHKYVCGRYEFTPASGVTTGIDSSKVSISGENTTRLSFEIKDDTVSYIYIPLLSSINGSKNPYGLWVGYEPSSGLTDDECYDLLYKSKLNMGYTALPWKPYNETTSKTVVTTEYIEGLDEYLEQVDTKVAESLSAIQKTEKSMVVNIVDNDLYVRCKDWKQDYDFVYRWTKVNPNTIFRCNKFLNMSTMYEIPVTSEDSDTGSLISWKGCGDDITPVNFNNTYIGANHGYSMVDVINVPSHGKTEVDIGSVWVDNSTGRTYCLLNIPDENTLRMVWFNDSMMSSGIFGSRGGCSGGTLTHSSGATNTSDIVITKNSSGNYSEMGQLYQSYNKYSISLLLDGQVADINENGTFACDRCELITQYDIIYIPAMLNYLMENVGFNTNDSQYSNDIQDYYITMYVNYQHNRNGSLSTYSSFYVNKNINVGYFGLVQSIALPSTSGVTATYLYLPDTTTYQSIYEHTGETAVQFSKSGWSSASKVPYRYFQFTSFDADKGVQLLFDRSVGWGENSKRLEHISSSCGFSHTSRKLYPYFIQSGTLTPGTYFDGLAVRVPLYKYDEDLTSVGWYWVEDSIVLTIDTHKALNKDIVLPNYMNNRRVEVLDKTDSCVCNQTYIFNNKLRFICTSDYGYLVLKLSK